MVGVALLATPLIFLCCLAFGATSGELVRNGLLSQGLGGQPLGWQHKAYFSTPDAAKFDWLVGTSGIGVVKIVNTKPNDSRWVQYIPVLPSTWYRGSAWVRTEKVLPNLMGAHLSVAETGDTSRDIRGGSDWQLVEFWMQTKPDQKSAELECRLGGFSSLTTGTAYFTGISLVRGEPPKPGEEAAAPESPAGGPNQRKVIVWLFTLVLTAGVILVVWRFVLPASWRTPP